MRTVPNAEHSRFGKVILIGAGPGDPDLITVRGKSLLESCDVVLYDNLVPEELIATLPSRIEKHYVGKKSGSRSMSQEEINRLMVSLACQGKNVARLKGSDPLVFGHGGEELQFLADSHIEYEVVPGVTSGIGAAAYAGIPLTDRFRSSFVILATGHEANDKSEPSVPWKVLSQASGGTLVIYMGLSAVGSIATTLMSSGMAPSTPSAAIERGTTLSQRIISCRLSDLAAEVRKHDIKSPALFIVGEVVRFRETLQWLEKRPLFGTRILVTAAAAGARELYRNLRNLGADVMPYPSVEIEECTDAHGWSLFDTLRSRDAAKWILFTSRFAVEFFIRQFIRRYNDIRALNSFRILAIGTGTAAKLAEIGIRADFVPTDFTTQAIVAEFPKFITESDTVIVRVRGNLGDTTVEDALRSHCADMASLQVYETRLASWPEGFKDKLIENRPQFLFFSSPSTVDGFLNNLSQQELADVVSTARVVSIGPATSQRLKEVGIATEIESGEHSFQGMINTLLSLSIQ